MMPLVTHDSINDVGCSLTYDLDLITMRGSKLAGRLSPLIRVVNQSTLDMSDASAKMNGSERLYTLSSTIPIRKICLDRDEHVFVVSDDDGALYYCGSNEHGQAGVGHTKPFKRLTKVRDGGIRDIVVSHGTVLTCVQEHGQQSSDSSNENSSERVHQWYMNGNNSAMIHPQSMQTEVLEPKLYSLHEMQRNCSSSTQQSSIRGVIDPRESLVSVSLNAISCVFLPNLGNVFVSGHCSLYVSGTTSYDQFCQMPVHGLESGERIQSIASDSTHCILLSNRGNVFVGGIRMERVIKSTFLQLSLDGCHKMDSIGERVRFVNCFETECVIVTESNRVFCFSTSTSLSLESFFNTANVANTILLKRLILDRPLPSVIQYCFLSRSKLMLLTERGMSFDHRNGRLKMPNMSVRMYRKVKASSQMTNVMVTRWRTVHEETRVQLCATDEMMFVYRTKSPHYHSMQSFKTRLNDQRLHRRHFTDIDFIFLPPTSVEEKLKDGELTRKT